MSVATDRAALVALYNATNEPGLDGRDQLDQRTSRSSSWHGVTTDGDGRVTRNWNFKKTG